MASIEDAMACKRAMFAQLDALNDPNDGAPDESYQASVVALTDYAERYRSMDAKRGIRGIAPPTLLQHAPTMKRSASSIEKRSSVKNSRLDLLRRSETTPSRASDNATSSEVVVIKDTPLPPRALSKFEAPGIGKAEDKKTLTTSSTNIVKFIGKRKRASGPPPIPEAQQIFQGLIMMFVPNNDIAPARRLRIQKATDYGASRAISWSSNVTHIIVDRDLQYSDVSKALKIDEVPSSVFVVDENYTASCIACKSLVDARQKRFHVRGMPAPQLMRPPEKPASEPSDRSLQLKPAKGADVTYEPRTPSRTDEESDRIVWPDTVSSTDHRVDELPSEVMTSLNGPLDELQKAIEEAKAAPSIPQALLDEETSRPSSSDQTANADSDQEQPSQKPNPAQKKKGYTTSADWQKTFTCMQSYNTKDIENPNSKTIAILQEMENYYYSIRDEWRTRAYRKAMATLRKQNHRITTKEEAMQLPEIGERLAAKIEEIVWTNKLQRLEFAKMESSDQVMEIFLKIYGVGFQQASKWVQEGYRSLDDLLKSPNVKLRPNQKIGIERYEDFQLRIPRPETEQLAALVKKCLQKFDPGMQIMIGGSYRRGAPNSSDIDLIITKKDASAEDLRKVTSEKAVPWLEKAGFLTAGLAVTSKLDGSKWHGACQLPLNPASPSVDKPNVPATNKNPWRRIDLLLVPWDELGAAMIYFTGNDIFNRSMRLLARKKGMRLNQSGLYKDVMRKRAQKLNEGTKISGSDEKEIFDILGVPYRGPLERDC